MYIDPTSQKRTFHNQYEPGFIVARDKSPLELLIENKDLLDFFCLTFGVQYIFNSLIYFLISHNYFTYPGSSNSFFSITYATFASLLIKEHISIKLQKLSDRKIPLIYNLIPNFYFTFLTDKIIIRSIYFRRFLCHFYQKIGQDC